ncbi:class I SAM-dependent methyltransferase [Lysobacter sp.]|uniref:class I SAM-dependent methyltransferase n=1 Tax=Lysobacter sp. TaxID=72226 RepID=UPI002D475CB0|nr:class I SAM-dependent methyltransferase [Lysobacter sp.]HZX77227.1 class I SAM-dependent methyltransferase [Lysobacter sp.]
MSHSSFLATVRAWELTRAREHMPPAASPAGARKLLELGAGTGQQALLLRDMGYDVTAIDLPSSHYFRERVFPVTDYDGHHIPCPSRSFDIVFSSNVLEHVRNIDQILGETRRVMADDGIAIHLLPTPSCRLWSIPAHYLWLIRRAWAAARPKGRRHLPDAAPSTQPRMPATAREWAGTLFPLRHGERGVTLTEPYFYSGRWWKRTFERNGFRIEELHGNGLFYTMANSATHSLSIETRMRLSRLFGSACNVFVLRKTGST